MKKLFKLPAILGGILCFLQVICYAKEILNSITGTYASFSIDSLIYAAVNLLLGIALLRGRKDRFLGLVLGVNGIRMAALAIWDIVGIRQLMGLEGIPASILLPRNLGNICALLAGILLLLLALDCFAPRCIPEAFRKKLFGGLMLIVGLAGVGIFLWSQLAFDIHYSSIGALNPVFIVFETLLTALTYGICICTGFAVAGSESQ